MLALIAALAFAAPATAAEIRRVDLVDYPEVAVTVLAGPQEVPTLLEEGRAVAGLEAENLGRAKSVVVAVDRSQSMEGKALADAVAAVRTFVSSKSPGDRVALVGFGSTALQLTRFSSSTIDSDLALRDLAVDTTQGTALNDAVALSARLLGREGGGARVLVVVTDGRDVSSAATAGEAAELAREHGVSVYAVGIESAQFSPVPLQELADSTGGAYRAASSSSELTAAYNSIAAELAKTWRLTYVTAARPGERVSVSVNGDEAELSVPGPSAKAPTPSPSPVVPENVYDSSWGSLGLALAVGVLVLLALALVASARRATWLRSRLNAHVAGVRRAQKRRQTKERFLAGSVLMRLTEQAFGHLKWWHALHRLLERADVPLRTVELVYISVGSALAGGLLAAVIGSGSIFVVGGLAAGAALPFGYLKFKARKRLKAFENQLPDLLLTLAAALKAGHSFKQGLQTVVDEGQPPASKEFTRVLAEARLGRPLQDALNEMAVRVNSKNLDFVITAVTIQGQVGGSLAGLFDMVAETVRQRQQFARKIRGLTAMGRASAYVLVGLPFFTAGIITVINPEFMDPLYNTSTGQKMMMIGAVSMVIGSLMLKKIVSFRG
jgi:tight adherence protein B